MPNCDFYAAPTDVEAVLSFVFENPSWTLWELASRHDAPLRSFRDLATLNAAFELGAQDLYLQLHAPEMGGQVHSKRINFTPGAVKGASHRFDSSGRGLIQLYLVVPRDDTLSNCHTNHNSEKGARKWEIPDDVDRVDDWDWQGVGRVSSRLNRFIRSIAVAKHGPRPVLPAAQALVESGQLKLLPEF